MSRSPEGAAPRPRRRGRPALIDRARILEAAKLHDPRTITMKKVADSLCVDPTTLNYHVRGRDGLLQMLAIDAFGAAFAAVEFSGDTDWRTMVRTFATAIHDGVVATGALALHLRVENDVDLATLAPFETTLTALVDAGFDLLDAAHALTLIGELADAAARRFLGRASDDTAESARELREALLSDTGPQFSSLRLLVQHEGEVDPGRQFEFDLRVLVLGLERLLADRST